MLPDAHEKLHKLDAMLTVYMYIRYHYISSEFKETVLRTRVNVYSKKREYRHACVQATGNLYVQMYTSIVLIITILLPFNSAAL